jgi:solute carrier family 25 oxoglutarate transporter 11
MIARDRIEANTRCRNLPVCVFTAQPTRDCSYLTTNQVFLKVFLFTKEFKYSTRHPERLPTSLVAMLRKPVLSFLSKLAIGALSGASSSLLANPLEVVLVRLQTDLSKPAATRRNYKGVFDGLIRVSREEGVAGLWSGAVPTVLRAAILNAAMLAAADETKERLAVYTGKGTVVTLLLSSFMSGIAASVASLPADMIKTRLQYQSPDINGKLKYSGIVHATRSIISEEGFFSLWRGLPTYTFRIGPHVFFTLVFLDAITPIVSSLLS